MTQAEVFTTSYYPALTSSTNSYIAESMPAIKQSPPLVYQGESATLPTQVQQHNRHNLIIGCLHAGGGDKDEMMKFFLPNKSCSQNRNQYNYSTRVVFNGLAWSW